MGTAAHRPGGATRLGLSATAATAVLYGAVVLFGLGPASPAVLETNDDLPAPVVHVQHVQHGSAVSGPAQRLPQASPGPVRHRSHATRHRAVSAVTKPKPPALPSEDSPTDTAGAGPTPPAPPDSAPSALSPSTLPEVAPAISDVTVPTVDMPQLPTLPALPPTPSLPSPPRSPLSVSLP